MSHAAAQAAEGDEPPPRNILLALDMGGTSVKAAAVLPSGDLLAVDATPLDRAGAGTTPDVVIPLLVNTGLRLLRSHRISLRSVTAVGVCTCAAIKDRATGVLAGSANLDGVWDGVPLQAQVLALLRAATDDGSGGSGGDGGGDGSESTEATLFSGGVYVTADADASAFAEAWTGAARGHPNSVHVCIGTGIGVSFLVDGQVLRGSSGIIEAGHVIVQPRGRQCGCGSRGCLEAYCAAPGIVETLRLKMATAAWAAAAAADGGADGLFRQYSHVGADRLPSCEAIFAAAAAVESASDDAKEEEEGLLSVAFRRLCRETVDEAAELLVCAGGPPLCPS